jgi:hypothetical protein
VFALRNWSRKWCETGKEVVGSDKASAGQKWSDQKRPFLSSLKVAHHSRPTPNVQIKKKWSK